MFQFEGLKKEQVTYSLLTLFGIICWIIGVVKFETSCDAAITYTKALNRLTTVLQVIQAVNVIIIILLIIILVAINRYWDNDHEHYLSFILGCAYFIFFGSFVTIFSAVEYLLQYPRVVESTSTFETTNKCYPTFEDQRSSLSEKLKVDKEADLAKIGNALEKCSVAMIPLSVLLFLLGVYMVVIFWVYVRKRQGKSVCWCSAPPKIEPVDGTKSVLIKPSIKLKEPPKEKEKEKKAPRQPKFAITKNTPLPSQTQKLPQRTSLEFETRRGSKRSSDDPRDDVIAAKRFKKDKQVSKIKYTDIAEILFPDEYQERQEKKRQRESHPKVENFYVPLTIKPSYERKRRSNKDEDIVRYNRLSGITEEETKDNKKEPRTSINNNVPTLNPKRLSYDGRPVGPSPNNETLRTQHSINNFKGYEIDRKKRKSSRKSTDSRSSRDRSTSQDREWRLSNDSDYNSDRKNSGSKRISGTVDDPTGKDENITPPVTVTFRRKSISRTKVEPVGKKVPQVLPLPTIFSKEKIDKHK